MVDVADEEDRAEGEDCGGEEEGEGEGETGEGGGGWGMWRGRLWGRGLGIPWWGWGGFGGCKRVRWGCRREGRG